LQAVLFVLSEIINKGYELTTIIKAQTAVRNFLEKSLPDVNRVNITKVAKIETTDGGWEAEADVWQPNPTLKSLNIQTQRPVLDQEHYLVRMDKLLNILAYEIGESIRQDG
jgi:hypothetical protein